MTSDASRPTAPSSYAEAGVDIDAGNELVRMIKPLVRATRRPGSDAKIGGFGALFDLKAVGYKDPILVATNDGVGTKVKIAAETGMHETIGIDLVAMCVNDLVVQGAEPLFFLDYFATAKLKPAVAATVIAGIAEGCRMSGAALIGGETAEMPGVYSGEDYDLAGFAVGAVERDKVLPRADVIAGDVVLGLSSSGLHSNGFSLVRRLVAATGIGWREEAPFEPGASLGRGLLTPTLIYVKSLLHALRKVPGIKAMAHITGGGLIENVPRVLPDALAARIDLGEIAVSPVFPWLASIGGIAEAEMLRTFNCGVGMVVVVAEEAADAAKDALTEAGEFVMPIGTIVPRTAGGVDFVGRLDLTPPT